MRNGQGKIKTALSSLERKAARFVNSVAELGLVTRLMQWLAGLTGWDIGVTPQPKRLLKEMFRQARIGRIQWDVGTYQCPDVYDVSVSQEAWDDYYSRNTPLICRNMEAMLTKRIVDDLWCEVNATVTIHIDHTLNPGEYAVIASYRKVESSPSSAPAGTIDGHSSPDEHNQSVRHESHRDGVHGATVKAQREGSQDETQRLDSIQEEATIRGDGMSGETGEPSGDTPGYARTVEQGNLADDHTPSMATPRATVSYRGVIFHVKHRSTIGVHRGQSKQADIVLAYCDDLYYVHRLHGTFTYNAPQGSWIYRQDGEHGSTLKRGETTVSLQKGDSTALEDSDELYLAEAQFPVIFRTGSAA